MKFNEKQRDAVLVALRISERLTSKLEAQLALDGDQFVSQVEVWSMFSVYEIEADRLRCKLLEVANAGIDVDEATGTISAKDGEV